MSGVTDRELVRAWQLLSMMSRNREFTLEEWMLIGKWAGALQVQVEHMSTMLVEARMRASGSDIDKYILWCKDSGIQCPEPATEEFKAGFKSWQLLGMSRNQVG